MAAPNIHRAACLLAALLAATPAAVAQPPRVDAHGDPLPDGAVLRLGTIGYRVPGVAGVGFRPSGELVALTEKLALHTWPADGSTTPTVTRVAEISTPINGATLSANVRYAAAQAGERLIVWDLSVRPPAEHV